MPPLGVVPYDRGCDMDKALGIALFVFSVLSILAMYAVLTMRGRQWDVATVVLVASLVGILSCCVLSYLRGD